MASPYEEKVKVNRARAEARPVPTPAERAFDADEAIEELTRRQLRVDRSDAVQEAGLLDVANGLRVAENRHRSHAKSRFCGQELERAQERRLTVSEVAAQADVGANRHGPSLD